MPVSLMVRVTLMGIAGGAIILKSLLFMIDSSLVLSDPTPGSLQLCYFCPT